GWPGRRAPPPRAWRLASRVAASAQPKVPPCRLAPRLPTGTARACPRAVPQPLTQQLRWHNRGAEPPSPSGPRVRRPQIFHFVFDSSIDTFLVESEATTPSGPGQPCPGRGRDVTVRWLGRRVPASSF